MIRHCTYPAPALAPLVAQFWSITASGGAQLPDYLPGTGAEILLNLADDTELLQTSPDQAGTPVLTRLKAGEAVCICPRTTRLEIRSAGETRLFSIRFRSAGFFSLFGIPLQHICDRVIPTEDLGISLPCALHNHSHNDSHIHSHGVLAGQLQHWLGTRHYSDVHTTPLSRAVDRLYYCHRALSVRDIQQATALSERSFQRHIKQITGVSAKYFTRTARFQATLKHLLSSPATASTDALLTQGYYDQSHFIRDFRHFTGTSPGEYLNSHHRHCNFYLPDDHNNRY